MDDKFSELTRLGMFEVTLRITGILDLKLYFISSNLCTRFVSELQMFKTGPSLSQELQNC